MTKQETKALLKLIFTAYPNFKIDTEVIKLWTEMLEEADNDMVIKRTKEYIKAEKFPPTIADVIAFKKKSAVDETQEYLREQGLID